jgi:hypothetical protein
MVKGDLVVPVSDVIMTRSRAKKSMADLKHTLNLLPPDILTQILTPDPDQYTIIPAPLKIVKLLIEELSSASGMLPPGTPGSAAAAAAASIVAELDEADADKGGLNDDDDDDGWEDEPGTIDLGLGSTKADLMALGGEGAGGGSRQRDDETQQYLSEFFVRAAHDNLAGFADWYGMLSDAEKARLASLAS